ncbi:MAG: hypothetical protein ABII82_15910, partial [Verrucomicrobiota bacterium]
GSHTGASGPAWGWFDPQNRGALTALWANFGPWLLVLPALAAWTVWRRATDRTDAGASEALAWVLPGLGLLLFSLVWKLQPWAWDNTKLMLWGWLACAPFVWRIWLARARLWLQVAACALLFGAGVAALLTGLGVGLRTGGYQVTTVRDVDSAIQARAALPPGTVVAAAPDYNQPLLLAGQPVMLGYDGHLWSHGIDYEERLGLLRQLMLGADNWREAARKLGVRHIYWGWKEAAAYPGSSRPWSSEATILYNSPAGTLYQLKD